MKKSAGILLYRYYSDILEVMIVHPSGNSKKWSLPKGEIDKGETAAEAAVRETKEECGFDVDKDKLDSLGSNVYKSKKKKVFAFATEFLEKEVPAPASWEIDEVRFVNVEEAKSMLHEGQVVFVDRLLSHLKGSNNVNESLL